MKLNEKQVESLKSNLGEKKFNEIVFGFHYEPSKIYLLKSTTTVYKLHFGNGLYSFIDLNTSNCHADGFSETAQERLSNNNGFRQFDSIKQAIQEGFFD